MPIVHSVVGVRGWGFLIADFLNEPGERDAGQFAGIDFQQVKACRRSLWLSLRLLAHDSPFLAPISLENTRLEILS